MKRVLAWCLVLVIFCSNVCFAAPKINKSESIFINLDYYGDVEQINVYNTCGIVEGKEIREFGDYESISNLTNKTEYRVGENGEKIWDVSDVHSFSYTGKVNNNNFSKVPWNFDVEYKLNGVPTSPKELLHKSGVVEVNLDIKPNKDTIDFYKNNYMLEITGTFDMSKYLSVESDEAMFVATGNTKTMMFIVLPGQEADFTIRLGTNDFEMNGLTFAMVPLEGKLLDEINEAVKDKENFEDAMKEINKSTDIVLHSIGSMSAGMQEMQNGMNVLKDSTDKLHTLSPERKESIDNLINSTKELKTNVQDSKKDLENINNMINNGFDMLDELNPKIQKMSKNLKTIESDLEDIEEIVEDLPDALYDIKKTTKTMSSLITDMAKMLENQDKSKDIDVEGLKTSMTKVGGAIYTIQNDLKPENMAGITEPAALLKIQSIGNNVKTIGEELLNVQTTLTEVEGLLKDTTTTQKGLITKLNTLSSQINGLSNMIDDEDGEVVINSVSDAKELIKELNSSLTTITNYTEDFLDDKENITNSIDNLEKIMDNMSDMLSDTNSLLNLLQSSFDIVSNDVYSGSNSTIDGMLSITDQMLNITTQSNQFINSKDLAKDAVKNEWNKIDDKTNLFKIDSSIKPVSFMSDKNEAPDKVQFLLKLPDIMEVPNNVDDLENTAGKTTFWQRILNIFKKMFGWIANIFKKK